MEIIIAIIAATAPTIAALAAWRASHKAVQQTNGHIQGPLARIELTLGDMLEWQVRHDRLHANEQRS